MSTSNAVVITILRSPTPDPHHSLDYPPLDSHSPHPYHPQTPKPATTIVRPSPQQDLLPLDPITPEPQLLLDPITPRPQLLLDPSVFHEQYQLISLRTNKYTDK